MDIKRTVVATALNPVVGDIELDETGDMVWVEDPTSIASIAQTLAGRLAFPKGTWYLNKNEGIPYFDGLLGEKGVSDAAWNAVFTFVILGTPGIAMLDSLNVRRDGRAIGLDFTARTAKGGVLTTADLGPFIVPSGLLG